MDKNQSRIVGTNGTVIGFGFNSQDVPSDKLLEANLTVLDKNSCIKVDKRTYGKYLTNNMFCASGKNNTSACNGDSGGGIYFMSNVTWYLRGIVSFSPLRPGANILVCDSSKPSVFTDVSKYLKWSLRYTNTTKWLEDLKPCKEEIIDHNAACNAPRRLEYDYLIAGVNDSIIRVPTNGDPAFPVRDDSNMDQQGGLDYDCVEGRFYWTEPGTRAIFSAKYDGTDKKAFIKDNLEEPGSVAVDWISRRLYWVDYGKETIEVASLDHPEVRTLVKSPINVGEKIVVDPLLGKLYRIHLYVGIEWMNLDGSEPELLLDSETHRISDMKVSMIAAELCYVNKGAFKIECIDTRSRRIRTIVDNLNNPDKLAIIDEFFYWTEDNRFV
ncbi:AGAP008193-PA-like protein [Anopheles sinensis]|uniref:AGAP008193-PA-like protein n=1 Tax=Anopheles sinensis TaxID=74873 RepID=A0A084VEK3_ANOSI|nr:AGAP008193-PA-like protein [Anopheles sinensis]